MNAETGCPICSTDLPLEKIQHLEICDSYKTRVAEASGPEIFVGEKRFTSRIRNALDSSQLTAIMREILDAMKTNVLSIKAGERLAFLAVHIAQEKRWKLTL